MIVKTILITAFAVLVVANVAKYSFDQTLVKGLPQIDIVCLITHCFSEMRTCFTNVDCRKAVICVGPCGSDLDCVMKCMINYANDELTDFMACASSDHSCLVLPPQDPPFTCTLPNKTDTTFNYKTMPGDWYVLLGGSPTYDCFPCQLTNFHPINANGSVDSFMNYQAIDNKGEIKKMQQVSHIVPDVNRTELLHLTSNDFGNMLEDDCLCSANAIRQDRNSSYSWLVIEPEKYMLIYYCGRMPTGGGDYWYYEGGVLYSKAKSLGAADKEKIDEAAMNAGININNWCSVDHSQCS